MFGWDTVIYVVISIVISLIAYAFAPKPKMPKPQAASEMENPTADAGRPIPVVFGTLTIKGPNFLWYGEKNVRTFKVKS